MTVPAHADSINALIYDTTPGAQKGGKGGNPTQEQLDDISAQNATALGVDGIALLGTVDAETGTFTAADGTSFDGTFVQLACAGGGDCTTGFSLTFDFGGLPFDWQIVQVAVKAASAKFAFGTFTLPGANDVQTGALADLQSATVAGSEYAKFVADANALCDGGGCKNGEYFNPAIGHIYVFGTPGPGSRSTAAAVPEPSTVLLLGSGLVGVVLVVRRGMSRQPSPVRART